MKKYFYIAKVALFSNITAILPVFFIKKRG